MSNKQFPTTSKIPLHGEICRFRSRKSAISKICIFWFDYTRWTFRDTVRNKKELEQRSSTAIFFLVKTKYFHRINILVNDKFDSLAARLWATVYDCSRSWTIKILISRTYFSLPCALTSSMLHQCHWFRDFFLIFLLSEENMPRVDPFPVPYGSFVTSYGTYGKCDNCTRLNSRKILII